MARSPNETSSEYVAGRTLRLVDPQGQQGSVTLTIDRCYQDYDIGSWVSTVRATGSVERIADNHGADSWQAVRLSQKWAIDVLKDLINQGFKIYLSDDAKPLQVADVDEFF